MRRDQPQNPHPSSARFFLWTIRKQDQITRCLTLNMWSVVSVLLATSLLGLVTLETALQIILWAGMAVGSTVWIFIERRRSWLLSISDPKLKAEAYRTMIDYLRRKVRPESHCRKSMDGCDASPTG